jgi:hypothetical protein
MIIALLTCISFAQTLPDTPSTSMKKVADGQFWVFTAVATSANLADAITTAKMVGDGTYNCRHEAGTAFLYGQKANDARVYAVIGAETVAETTVCKFRHLLEEHNLGEEVLGTVNLHLQGKGVRITTGTIVDATLIHAPSSTKNREQSRDPEMHQAKKGEQWYFGMKAHVGVDSKTKMIHTAVVTAANVSDAAVLPGPRACSIFPSARITPFPV